MPYDQAHSHVGLAPARPPHPATVAQKKPAVGMPAARPPHPATVAQKKPALGVKAERPPHPATMAQPRAPHAATVVQRTSLPESKKASKKKAGVSFDLAGNPVPQSTEDKEFLKGYPEEGTQADRPLIVRRMLAVAQQITFLLNKTQFGTTQVTRLNARILAGWASLSVVGEDLPFGQGGEARISMPNVLILNKNHHRIRQAITAGHELQHHHQYYFHVIDESSDVFDKAASEIQGHQVGVGIYKDLKPLLVEDDKDTGAIEVEYDGYVANSEKWRRDIFREQFYLHSGKTKKTSLSDGQIDTLYNAFGEWTRWCVQHDEQYQRLRGERINPETGTVRPGFDLNTWNALKLARNAILTTLQGAKSAG